MKTEPHITITRRQFCKICLCMSVLGLLSIVPIRCHLQEKSEEDRERSRQIEEDVQKDIEKTWNRVLNETAP